jgi:hypothetical protein
LLSFRSPFVCHSAFLLVIPQRSGGICFCVAVAVAFAFAFAF